MQRTRMVDIQLSRAPSLIGACQDDLPTIARYLNAAQERLLYAGESGDEGWSGTWAEVAFSVDRRYPYITTPRGIARLEAIDVCKKPVPLHNSFYEYMLFGNGRMPKDNRWRSHGFSTEGYTRNNSCTFTDISNPPQQIQIFAANSADTTANAQTGAIPRVLLQGLDQNGAIVTSMDGNNLVQGEFVTLTTPYALSKNSFSTLTGIQKDVTQGEVQIFQSDPTWGTAEILLTMEPTETTGWYRRYYLNGIPCGCCDTFRPILVNKQPPLCDCPLPVKNYVQVTALAKLDLIPVVAPTDYTLIQSKEALIHEMQAVHYSEIDSASATAKEQFHHKAAIALLIGELAHFQGKNNPAILFKPFGSASLRRVNIGMT